MIKLVLLYDHPPDPQAFDEWYFGTHCPLARKVPGLERLEVAKIEQIRGGGDPPYYLISELWYADDEAMAAATATPEHQRAREDREDWSSVGSIGWICRVVD